MCANLFSQTLKSHSKEDLIKFSKMTVPLDDSFGFTSEDELPVSFDLKFFAPPVLSQTGGSCVGHAIATSLSITYNAVNKITEYGRCYSHQFDPYYIYTALKDEDISSIGCDRGAYIWEGFELVENYGIKKQWVSPELTCRDRLSKKLLLSLVDQTSNYTIDGFQGVVSWYDDGSKEVWDIDKIKNYIFYGFAPVVGIDVGDDFDNVSGSGIYKLPKKMHYQKGELSGHAVTLIGWDDQKNGGSFLFQNSYGTDWGDGGFFWVSYRDFYNEVDVAIVMYKEDFSDWKSNFMSGNYYKGAVYDGDVQKEGCFYEGQINPETNLFHGYGIFGTPTLSALGWYENGRKDGWWFVAADMFNSDGTRVSDPFFGEILFDKGEIIEEKSYGFTLGQTNNKETFTERLRLDSYDLPMSDEPATIDDFNESDVKLFTTQLSGLQVGDVD